MQDENTGTDWNKQPGSIWPAPQPAGTPPTPPSSMGGAKSSGGTWLASNRQTACW